MLGECVPNHDGPIIVGFEVTLDLKMEWMIWWDHDGGKLEQAI
jgi:hypothetical protein